MPSPSTRSIVRRTSSQTKKTATKNPKKINRLSRSRHQPSHKSRASRRSASQTDLHKPVSQLLAELVRDKHVSTVQFRRMAMTAGALPADFFPKDSGTAYTKKADILMRLIERDRAAPTSPRFATRVTNWLSDAMQSRGGQMLAYAAKPVVAAVDGAANFSLAVAPMLAAIGAVESTADLMRQIQHNINLQQSRKPAGNPEKDNEPSHDKLPQPVRFKFNPIVAPTMVCTLAAMYLTLRQSIARHHTQRQRQLVALRIGVTDHPGVDEAFRRTGLLKHLTYHGSDCCCLQGGSSVDKRWHQLFLTNEAKHRSSMPHLRKSLLALRQQALFGDAHRLLNRHLFRSDGNERTSPAEIAYAMCGI